MNKVQTKKGWGGKRSNAGRPVIVATKPISLKIEVELLALFEDFKVQVTNRNKFINDAIREKFINDGYMKQSIEANVMKYESEQDKV